MLFTVFGFRSGAALISSSVPGSAPIARLPGPKQQRGITATLLLCWERNRMYFRLCSGSRSTSVGSVCFWAFWIRTRIRNLFDPSVNKKKKKKNLDFYCFVPSLWLFIFKEKKRCKCTLTQIFGILKATYEKSRIRICYQRYGSEDPHPDPYQNVAYPEHWLPDSRRRPTLLGKNKHWALGQWHASG
jgi:hypothetical protein